MSATYRRAKHAAHYGNGGGHDLEQWDVSDQPRSARTGDPLRPEGVPSDAVYHSGYRARDGEQRWLFVRRAPMSEMPECPMCVTAAASAVSGR